MSSEYLSQAAAGHAEQIQHDHGPDDDGWCNHCLRHFNIRVRAGWCKPWQRAQAFINAYLRQQDQIARRPRPAPRTGSG